MRIERLELLRYGKFADRTLAFPRQACDFHVVVGPNEAGKSTVRQAIVDLLYGIPRNTPLGFVHDMSELRLGARLEQGDRAIDVLRVKGNRHTLREAGGTPLPDDALVPFIGAGSREFFVKMFGLDHPALVDGGHSILSASDDVGQILFQSAAGVATLGRVRAELEQEAEQLWTRRRAESRLYYQAADQLDRASAALRAATTPARAWLEAEAAVQAATAALADERDRHARISRRRDLLERVRRVGPILLALDDVQQRLDTIGEGPLLPAEASVILAQATGDLAREQVRIDELAARATRLREALALVQVDPSLQSHADAIAELDAQRLQYRAYPDELERLETEIAVQTESARLLCGRLGWSADTPLALAARLPTRALRVRAEHLLRAHAALVQGLQTAERAERRQRDALAQAEARLLALPDPGRPTALQAVLATAHAFARAPVLRDEATRLLDRRSAALRQALADLRPWPLDAAGLSRVDAPPESELQALLQEDAHDQARVGQLRQDLSEVAHRLDQARIAVQLHQRAHAPVGLQEVLAMRRQRDLSWQALRAAPETLAQRADRLEEQMLAADTLADRRHDTAHEAAELERREDEVTRLQAQHRRLGADLHRLEAGLSARAAVWSERTQAAGMPDVPLRQAADWLIRLRRAQDAATQCADARAEVQALDTRIRDVARQLAAALRDPEADRSEPDLARLLAEAEARLAEVREQILQRRTLQQAIDDARAAAAELAAERETAQAALAGWSADWQALLGRIGRDPAEGPAEIEVFLELSGQLDEVLQSIRRLRSERVEAMRAELLAHAEATAILVDRIAPELASAPVADQVTALMARVANNQKAHEEGERLRAALRETDEALLAAHTRRRAAQARLVPLAQAAALGVDEVEVLAEAVRRSDLRRTLEAERAAQRRALLEHGDGRAIDLLRAEIAGVDPGLLRAELEQLAAEEGARVRALEQRASAVQQAEQVLARIDGGSDAARAEAQRQEALAAMAAVVERYLKVFAGARLLRWSIDRFREQRQGPMLAEASRIFADLTLGAFERLVVDFEQEPPRLLGRRADGSGVPVTGLSDGTRDQLFLALRLAALHMHLGNAQALPFIADDLFINYDDARSRAGFAALAELARRTQVVFLTHHDHLLPGIRVVLGADVNVVHLADPVAGDPPRQGVRTRNPAAGR